MSPRLILTFILLGAFLLKVPVLNKPLFGHFGSYQVVNGMMAEMMLRGPFSAFFVPTTMMLREGAPSLHLLYYPFGSALAAGAKTFLGGSLDFWGRLQAALSMMGAGWVFFQIVKKDFSAEISLWACVIFSFSPMALISGMSFQNEAIAVLFLVTAFWLVSFPSGLAKFASGLVFSLALVARIHFVVLFPVFLLALMRERVRWKNLWLWVPASLLPVSAWYGFMYYLEKTNVHSASGFFGQLGEGRILVESLLASPEFYRRIGTILTGPWVTPLILPFVLWGLFRWTRENRIFILWLLCSLTTIVLLPQKAADHPFYLISGVPAAAVLAAVSAREFLSRFGKGVSVVFLGAFSLLVLRYYVPPAFFVPPAEAAIPEMSRELGALTQKEDLVVAPSGAFLYYAHRFGWPFNLEMEESPVRDSRQARHLRLVEKGYGDPVAWLETLRGEGADYLVVSEPERLRQKKAFFDYVSRHYAPVNVPSGSFLMFDLRKESSVGEPSS